MDTARVTREIFVLLFFCGAGLACRSGWFGFKGICYQVSLITYDVRMARRYCQIAGGDLAYIDSLSTLQFLNIVKNYDGQHSYWLRENSTLLTESTTTASSDEVAGCAYSKILTIENGDCNGQRYFVCEAQEETSDMDCLQGFDVYASSCYKAVLVPLSFSEAVKHCILLHGRLAVFDDRDKQRYAEALVIGKNATFFVGAKAEDDVFMWSNEKAFNVSCGSDCMRTDEGSCMGFLSIPEHQTRFLWTSVNCSTPNYFLCEVNAVEKSTTPAPTEAPTTPLPYVCPYGYYWKADESEQYCYWETTYESPRLNWYQARSFCQLFGGDLASYQDTNQEDRGLGGAKGHYKGLWIGLQRGEDDVFRWVDGRELNYSNWDYGQPNLKSRSKFCVSHGASHSRWELDYCGVRRWFVCRAPKVTVQRIPDTDSITKKTKCNIAGVSVYRNSWWLYKDHCYLINEKSKYSWDTARLFCQDNDAHMASINSFNETNFIVFAASVLPDTDYWIGLSSTGLHASYSWTDGSPLNFLYWADDAQNDTQGINSCISFNKRDGSWKVEHCNRLKGVICKRAVNASYEFTTPQPTPATPGHCEIGWYNLGNRCYKYFGKKWSQRGSWVQANNNCKDLAATLASVHNQDEQDFLVDLVLEASTDVWIGLKTVERGTVFDWSDGSRMDYTNWYGNKPEFSADSSEDPDPLDVLFERSEMCVEMTYDKDLMGKWNDVACHRKKGYICQKSKDPSITTEPEDPFACSNITGWYKLSSSCYKILEDKGASATWLGAQTQCRSYGANLANYKHYGVALYLNRRIKNKNEFFWIGARETSEDKYERISGEGLLYTDWLSGQPQRASFLMDNCVAVTSAGKWVVRSCRENHPYICEWNSEINQEPVVEHVYSCTNVSYNFEDLGGDNCYYFMPDLKLTWNEAMHYCFRHGGYLASMHSRKEVTLVHKYLLDNTDAPFLHIGLGKRRDGSYAWVDNSPLDFTWWDVGEPDNSAVSCVYIYAKTGKWNDVDCDETRRGFICSYPKKHISFEKELEVSAIPETVTTSKLTPGSILVIVICVLVILAVIGGTVYYLWPKETVQPKLLEPDAL